jgi:hypothetical protein
MGNLGYGPTPTFTARASGLSLAPLQAGHVRLLMYFSISSRWCSELVSLKRLARLLITPSNGTSFMRRP